MNHNTNRIESFRKRNHLNQKTFDKNNNNKGIHNLSQSKQFNSINWIFIYSTILILLQTKYYYNIIIGDDNAVVGSTWYLIRNVHAAVISRIDVRRIKKNNNNNHIFHNKRNTRKHSYIIDDRISSSSSLFLFLQHIPNKSRIAGQHQKHNNRKYIDSSPIIEKHQSSTGTSPNIIRMNEATQQNDGLLNELTSTSYEPILNDESRSNNIHSFDTTTTIKVLGICGGIGSGKSTACQLLVSEFHCLHHIGTFFYKK